MMVLVTDDDDGIEGISWNNNRSPHQTKGYGERPLYIYHDAAVRASTFFATKDFTTGF